MSSRARRFSISLPGSGMPLRILLPLQASLLVATMIVIGIVDRGDTVQLAWALLLLITVSSFVRLISGAEGLAGLLAIVVYGGLQLARTIQQGVNYFPEIFAGVACFAVVAWIGRAVAQRTFSLDSELRRDTVLIEELTLRDTVSGAIRSRHSHQLLVEEVERSRRYNHSLCLMVVGPDGWESVVRERGRATATELLVQVGEILVRCVRNVDMVCRHGESQFALILPETPTDGARIVAERIRQTVAGETQLVVRVGIAEFPTDAVTSDALVSEAEAALQFARTAEAGVVDRRLLT